MATRVKFEEWLPDQPAMSGAILDAKNVYPVSMGYSPFPNSEEFSLSASENLNSVAVAKYGNDINIFAGGDTKLFKFNNTTRAMDDASKTGGYASTNSWKFVQFGSVMLAANNQAKLQSWTVPTSTQWDDVDTNAPIAKYVTVVRDFVVCANLDGGSNPNKVQWSDINDETTWASGTTSQSDYQIIPDGGNITGLTGGEMGLIFLEKSIVRMTYAGSPLFFQFDVISRGLGCLEGNSIAQYGATSFFLSDDGFYKCDGQTVTGIGTEKVDRYFFNNVDLDTVETMSAAVDPVKKLVVWNYPTVDGGRSILIYNWQLNKWSRATTNTYSVGTIATTGYTLEGLELVLGYDDIDNMGDISLDDRTFVGGKFLFAGTQNNKIMIFSGSAYNAEIITSDIELGYNSVVTLVRPQIDGGSANIKVASRKELDDNIQFGSLVTTSQEGRANFRSFGRYHRFSVQPTGNWTNAVSIDVDVKPQGSR
jgi:hypothetical protein